MNKIIKPRIVRLPRRVFPQIADRVLTIERRGFTKPERWDSDNYEEGIEAFRGVYNLPFARSFGAYVGGTEHPEDLVGYALIMPVGVAREQFREDDGSPTDKFNRIPVKRDNDKYVWTFDVDQDWQGQGVGTSLMERVVREARRDGARHLYLYSRVEPRTSFVGRKCGVITDVPDFAETGVTYFLERMRL